MVAVVGDVHEAEDVVEQGSRATNTT